ncbi:MAG: 16S rRNA (cytidine(1402)-2'-O)-methyltransferase [Patescibacteria group bacterium]|nr:16S rRNA (cytidine(1402)-2'-O)-methyltransferase [Patescibacteria group bacterium]
MNGTLFIVATPIGNLEDITARALRVMAEADLIACEDTRRTKVLLSHYNIETPAVSYHQHSQLAKLDFLIGELSAGKFVALVSDAGTPGVSDPGGVLVERALAAGIPVVAVPGVSALTALASIAGIPMDKFIFLGFLPHKKGRETEFKKLAASEIPVIFYESPHRILKTLEKLSSFPGRVIVGREMTKKFEEIFRGTGAEALEHFSEHKINGEFTIIFYR